LGNIAVTDYFQDRYADALKHLREALPLLRKGDYAPMVVTPLHNMSSLYRELGDKGRLSFALNALAGLHHETHNLDAAVPLFEEALALTRELDDQESISIHLTNLARALVDRGTSERVRGLVLEGLAIARAIGSTRGEGYVVEVTASLAVLENKWEAAARFYGAVQARFQEIGFRRTPADDAFLDFQIARARKALGDEAFTAAEAAGSAAPWEQMLDEVRAWLER
jgi:tetratricopeptide (TPR) repeat protein